MHDQATRLGRAAGKWVLAGLPGTIALALAVAGWRAALACVTGALLAGASTAWMARSAATIVESGARGSSAGRRAFLGLLARHAALSAALFVAVAALPAPWLVVGVTLWPVALLIAGLRLNHVATPIAATTRT